MAKKTDALLRGFSTADLKRLLAVRERVDALEERRADLVQELAGLDRELSKLLAAARAGKAPVERERGRRAKGRKAGSGKARAARKGRAAQAAAPAKGSRKAGRGKAAGGRKVARGGKVRLEDVIVAVLKEHGPKVAFKDLQRTIVAGKLYATRSKDFSNVLRRTLSTSKRVKRVGRGIYAAA